MSNDSVLSFGPQPSQYNAQKNAPRGGSPNGGAIGGGSHRGPNHQEEGNGHELDINRTPPLGSDSGSCTQCAAGEESPDATRGNATAGPVYTQAAYDTMSSGPQPYPPPNQGSVAAGPAAAARPGPPHPQQFAPGAYPSPMAYGQGAGPGAAQLYTPVSMSNPSMYNHPQQQQQQQYGMPAPGPQYQQSPPQQQQQQQQQYATGNSSNSSLYGPQSGVQAPPPPPQQEAENNTYYGPSNNNNNNLKSVSSGFSYNTAFNTAANAMAGGPGAVNNGSVASSVLPGPYNNASANIQQQQQQQQQQQPVGYSASTYAPSLAGVSAYDANQTSTQPMYVMEDPVSTTSRVAQAGKYALGALAAGAVGYGVHNIVDQHLSSGDKEKESRKKQDMERQRQEMERQRREAEARHRREEEEQRRRDEYERWRRDEEVRRKQQEALNVQYQQQQYGYAPHPHLQRPDSVGSHHSHQSDGSFAPPAPFGRPPYSYNPNDVRHPDPTRSSENSPTPQTYPELRQSPSDPVIKIGTLIALKHVLTGRFLHSDRSHSTVSGSNQQLVYAHRHNTDENDWWQVLPANHEVPVPGSIVAYGTQIRLRHVQTGRHLHSQYMFQDRMGNNEVSAYGDQTLSDECDHWVVERWGEGAYNQTWKSTDTVVLRHYVSGMALHSHDVMLRDNVQSVVCTGNGTSENAKWRLTLSK
ncbi:hypothetical protein GGI23_000827 [Coemansia sp. RSA 2559]|nr:hypothetical protein GGI23_000827 [Coemansia sp. RSA 2559]KAJ2868734.1 hypothetical protein GGI22_000682 [Coemansia erecta]